MYYIFNHDFPAIYLISTQAIKKKRTGHEKFKAHLPAGFFRSAIFPGPNLLSLHDVLHGLNRTCKALA